MKFVGITPIEKMDNIWVKREDIAYWSSLEYPSGSKVRQYLTMAAPDLFKFYHDVTISPDSIINHSNFDLSKVLPEVRINPPPCIVGCSANSAMAIYVASTAKILRTKGIIYTAKRRVRSEGINYALSLGAEVHEMGKDHSDPMLKGPGYLSVIKKKARERARQLGQVVQWNVSEAIKDTIAQCVNIPPEVKRIIVPTGSGLTAAGVLIGVSKKVPRPIVVAAAVSPMATKESIWKLSGLADPLNSKYFGFIQPTSPYNTPVIAQLPDGTPLDPLYAAKAWQFMSQGDCLWPPGLRPVISMPEECKIAFKDWKGPQ